ncbi:hypothetical protein ACIBEJ_34310 [Nonomuraea sp. NPDC050790]|uniref:hypothetical protein n=1 Tax=Nonomuraea sp. NPDC050790 TaxID=3364371 RepID=UPI0037B7A687
MVRIKNISGEHRRVGRADGPLVEAGKVTQAPGYVLEELGDAYVIGGPDDVLRDPDTNEPIGYTGQARAWPKDTWELVPEAKSSGKGEQ